MGVNSWSAINEEHPWNPSMVSYMCTPPTTTPHTFPTSPYHLLHNWLRQLLYNKQNKAPVALDLSNKDVILHVTSCPLLPIVPCSTPGSQEVPSFFIIPGLFRLNINLNFLSAGGGRSFSLAGNCYMIADFCTFISFLWWHAEVIFISFFKSATCGTLCELFSLAINYVFCQFI